MASTSSHYIRTIRTSFTNSNSRTRFSTSSSSSHDKLSSPSPTSSSPHGSSAPSGMHPFRRSGAGARHVKTFSVVGTGSGQVRAAVGGSGTGVGAGTGVGVVGRYDPFEDDATPIPILADSKRRVLVSTPHRASSVLVPARTAVSGYTWSSSSSSSSRSLVSPTHTHHRPSLVSTTLASTLASRYSTSASSRSAAHTTTGSPHSVAAPPPLPPHSAHPNTKASRDAKARLVASILLHRTNTPKAKNPFTHQSQQRRSPRAYVGSKLRFEVKCEV